MCVIEIDGVDVVNGIGYDVDAVVDNHFENCDAPCNEPKKVCKTIQKNTSIYDVPI